MDFHWNSRKCIITLVSGGFDSTVASYLTMKRGIKTHFLFSLILVVLSRNWCKTSGLIIYGINFGSSHRVSFISIPLDDVVTEIFKSVSEPYMGVMLKRRMLKS